MSNLDNQPQGQEDKDLREEEKQGDESVYGHDISQEDRSETEEEEDK